MIDAIDREPGLRARLGVAFFVTTVSIVRTIKAPVPVRAEDGLYYAR